MLFGLMTTVSAQPLETNKLLSAEAAFGAKARILDGKTIEVRFDVAGLLLVPEAVQAEVAGKLIPATRASCSGRQGQTRPHIRARWKPMRGAHIENAQCSCAGAGPAVLKITTQGCSSESGVCYPYGSNFQNFRELKQLAFPERGDDGSFAAKSSLRAWVQNLEPQGLSLPWPAQLDYSRRWVVLPRILPASHREAASCRGLGFGCGDPCGVVSRPDRATTGFRSMGRPIYPDQFLGDMVPALC